MCDLLEAIACLGCLLIVANAGGESSLATMALLLSLGEHVDSPFRSVISFVLIVHVSRSSVLFAIKAVLQ